MKIVSFGDVHMAIGQMNKIALELATADLVILSGDLTTFGGIADTTKVLTAADKDVQPFVLKGGVVDGRAVSAADIRQIAELPPRAVLLGRLVGSLASPMRGFVSVCHGNIRKLVYALEAVRQAKEKSAA